MNIDRFVFIMEASMIVESFKSQLTDATVLLFANANGVSGEVTFEAIHKKNNNELSFRVNIETKNKRMLSDESAYIETIKTVLLNNTVVGEIQFTDIKIIKCRLEEMLEEVPELHNKNYMVFSDNEGYYYIKSTKSSSTVYLGYLKFELMELPAFASLR